MKIILFGSRGSRPLGASQGSPFEKYGGDTTSVAVIGEDGTLIALDAGTGFWKWPYTLEKIIGKKTPHELNLFFTHYHDDHTAGITQSPFLFHEGNKINIHGPAFRPGLKRVFNAKANSPSNPDLAQHYRADLSFQTLRKNNKNGIKLSDTVTIRWMPVPHGNEESYTYRIDEAGQGDKPDQSFVFLSDTHHSLGKSGAPIYPVNLLNFIRGANAMMYDCHYSDDEIAQNPALYLGMGHSSGEHGVRLCDEAEVPLLITHHHDPNKTDDDLDALTAKFARYGRKHDVDVIAAQPSLMLDLSLSRIGLAADLRKQDTAAKRWDRISKIAV